MKKIISILSGLFLFASLNTSAGDFLLNEYNVITIENFTSSGGTHVDGKTFIGGDLIGTDESKNDFGQRLDQNSPVDITALTVVGKLDGKIGTNKHDIVLNSEKNTVTAATNSNQVNINDNEIESNIDNVKLTADLDAIKADYKAQLENSSAYFASLDANSTLEKNKYDSNTLTLAINNGLATDDIAVFSLDGSSSIFDLNSHTLGMTGNNAADLDYIIINVAGDDLKLSGGTNMSLDTFGPKIIWNFYEAKSIDLYAQQFVGALLAPYATVTQTGGNINGSVGVLSLITNAEVHLLTDVDVNVPTDVVKPPGSATEVPEPSTLMLMFIAMAGLIYKRKTLNV
jgi:choice-of-anchor A domain-containing protein